jgi:hypothetical protein
VGEIAVQSGHRSGSNNSVVGDKTLRRFKGDDRISGLRVKNAIDRSREAEISERLLNVGHGLRRISAAIEHTMSAQT